MRMFAGGGGAGICGGFGAMVSPAGMVSISGAGTSLCAVQSDRSPQLWLATKTPPTIECGSRATPMGVRTCHAAGVLMLSGAGGRSRTSHSEVIVLCPYAATRCGGSFIRGAGLALREAIWFWWEGQ